MLPIPEHVRIYLEATWFLEDGLTVSVIFLRQIGMAYISATSGAVIVSVGMNMMVKVCKPISQLV